MTMGRLSAALRSEMLPLQIQATNRRESLDIVLPKPQVRVGKISSQLKAQIRKKCVQFMDLTIMYLKATSCSPTL